MGRGAVVAGVVVEVAEDDAFGEGVRLFAGLLPERSFVCWGGQFDGGRLMAFVVVVDGGCYNATGVRLGHEAGEHDLGLFIAFGRGRYQA